MTFPGLYDFEDQPSTIAWNATAHRFYDVNTGGFVSNLTGLEHLHAGRPFGRAGYVDDLGRAVPSINQLVPQYIDLQFVNQLRRASAATGDVYNNRAPTGSYYLSMGLYTDDDGNARILLVPSKGGSAINLDDEQRRMARVIASELGIPEGAEGTKVIIERITQIYHFVVK